jgi:sarcosine oxidase
MIRQAYWEDPRYVPLLLRSYELWEKLEQDSGESLLHITGGLVIGRKGGQFVERSVESARQFDLPHKLLGAEELKKRFPVMTVKPDTIALLEDNAGYLVPEKCVEVYLREAACNGARLHTNEAVLDWKAEERGDGVTVRTTNGTYSAERLVITAGPWTPQILADLTMPLRVTRQVLYWFEPSASIDLFRKDRLPVYMFKAEAGKWIVYGFPLTGAASEGVKVALHGSHEVCAPETVCREIRPSDEQLIREHVAGTVPLLAGRLLRAETCLYTMTPDENFIIDTHPRHPAVVLAAGFSGHGFKFAPVIGEIVADRASGGEPKYDLSLFSLARFRRSVDTSQPVVELAGGL